MSKIEDAFIKAEQEGRIAVITFNTAGFPTIDISEQILEKFCELSDIVEIGIPFSDPLADGPTIQKSSQIALNQGINTDIVFKMVKNLRKKTDTPLIAMTYYNLFYRYGLKKFAMMAKECGIDGVIIPDLPPEEAKEWLEVSRDKVDTIFLIASTSSIEQIKRVGELTNSFIYCVSVTGVTGGRDNLPVDLDAFITKVKDITGKRVAVGFGVSTPDQVANLAKVADGIISASALIEFILEDSTDNGIKKSLELVKKFKENSLR